MLIRVDYYINLLVTKYSEDQTHYIAVKMWITSPQIIWIIEYNEIMSREIVLY